MDIIKTFEELPKWAKILLLIFVGGIISCVYRIVKFLEKGNKLTLIVGIVTIFPPFDVIAWVVDFITELLSDKITVLAD